MSNQSHGAKVETALERAVAANCLPDDVQQRAEKLLVRLRQPVRIGLMGLPKSGKSTLLNLLVGQDVLPHGIAMPTLQLGYGSEPQTVCTQADGSKVTLPHADAARIAEIEPVFVEMQMPLPALAKISVLEVVAPADQTALHRASQWAAKRCDVALWCSQLFTPEERAIWSAMPDLIKDHAFLMLTMADQAQAEGRLDATVAAVRNLAADEFNQILPIATTRAISARQPDGSVDKRVMRESGGLALIAGVLKQVEYGRQSAVDSADILLHQHADLLAKQPEPESSPEAAETAAAAEAAAPETAKPASAEPVTPVVTQAAPPEPAVAPEPTVAEEQEPSPAQSELNVVSLKPATRDAYEHVVAYIVDQSRALIDLAEKLGDAAPAKIMAKAVEHVQWLSDYLNENGDDADPALARARDMAMDAADLVQLMKMERRDSAAVEALSLMIQIKHELQADLAA